MCLLAARLALIFIPFPRLARHLGTFVPPTDARVAQARNGGRARPVATRRRYRLGGDARGALCAVQGGMPAAGHGRAGDAQAPRRQERHAFRRGQGQDKPLDAHAWLDAAGVEVTGYPVAENFAEIACFV